MHLSVAKRTKATKTNAIFSILILSFFFLLHFYFFRSKYSEKKTKNRENTMMKLNYPYLFTLAAAL